MTYTAYCDHDVFFGFFATCGNLVRVACQNMAVFMILLTSTATLAIGDAVVKATTVTNSTIRRNQRGHI